MVVEIGKESGRMPEKKVVVRFPGRDTHGIATQASPPRTSGDFRLDFNPFCIHTTSFLQPLSGCKDS
jgi:hypothetical protein